MYLTFKLLISSLGFITNSQGNLLLLEMKLFIKSFVNFLGIATPFFLAKFKVFPLDKQIKMLLYGAKFIITSFEINFLCLLTKSIDSAPIGIKKS